MLKPRARAWRRLLLVTVAIGAMWTVIGIKAYEPLLGLDLQGGISVALTPAEGQPTDEGSLDKAVDIIRERVDAFGVSEPDITRQGENIIIQLAGISAEDQDRAFELIGSTAKLAFRPVGQILAPADPAKPKDLPKCDDPETYPKDDPETEIIACAETRDPESGELLPLAEWDRMILGPSALGGELVTGATAQLDPQGISGWSVSLDLNGEGEQAFRQITGQLACKRGQPPQDQLAIVLDQIVRSAPSMGEGVVCNQGIGGGQAEITGGFGEADATDLALVLRYGALPIELEPSTTTTVSPTLGRESLRSGLLASAIGIAVVFLYVAAFYRFLGLIIWLGIAIHGAVTLAIIIFLGRLAGFSLSLAGIAGLIVSLGIAADSFIVYFERIKDEIAEGRSARTAVERAWPSARRTIIAADIVTALAATVLYLLAVGSVRGFALMLGLSTTLDLIVSFLFMHPALTLLGGTKLMRGSGALGARTASAEGRA